MFKVTALTCNNCNTVLSAPAKNRILVCKRCETAHEFRNGDVETIRLSYSQSPGDSQAEQVYLPFWVLDTEITVSGLKIVGGKIRRFMKGEHSLDGEKRIWICAGDIPDDQAEALGLQYTKENPEFEVGMTPGIPGIPVTCDHHEAMQIADYLFLKNEIERSGTLQSIEYTIDFHGSELIFLPFEKGSNGLKPLI